MRGKRQYGPPWRKLPKSAHTRHVLRAWRRYADRAAKIKGARHACGLCKRAMQGMARVAIYTPWPAFAPRWRWLCSECRLALIAHLDVLEYELDRFDLPIDRVSLQETTGRARVEHT